MAALQQSHEVHAITSPRGSWLWCRWLAARCYQLPADPR
ncbi:hypothetical protein SynMINOS11_01335 [Synechococcus sp. Minos11]|nr:hypothetical protein SynMINOS11_01335 [Synechococcus sp. Minos11]